MVNITANAGRANWPDQPIAASKPAVVAGGQLEAANAALWTQQ